MIPFITIKFKTIVTGVMTIFEMIAERSKMIAIEIALVITASTAASSSDINRMSTH